MSNHSSWNTSHNDVSTPWSKQNSTKTAESSPLKYQSFETSSDAIKTPYVPMALIVSPSGEQVTCPVESLNSFRDLKTTNPFENDLKKDSDTKLDENVKLSLPSKKEKLRQEIQSRRRIQAKIRGSRAKIIFTKKCATDRYNQQSITTSVQTDVTMAMSKNPEAIGDGQEYSRSCIDLLASTSNEVISVKKPNQTNEYSLSENIKRSFSFLLMIFLILSLLSIVLEVDIVAEFYRIVLNEIDSLKQGLNLKSKPKTFMDIFWDFIEQTFGYLQY